MLVIYDSFKTLIVNAHADVLYWVIVHDLRAPAYRGRVGRTPRSKLERERRVRGTTG
jgi:hypothetical protein